MTQAERDRLVALKKAKKKLITQKQAAEARAAVLPCGRRRVAAGVWLPAHGRSRVATSGALQPHAAAATRVAASRVAAPTRVAERTRDWKGRLRVEFFARRTEHAAPAPLPRGSTQRRRQP
jgi:hypothetical protein